MKFVNTLIATALLVGSAAAQADFTNDAVLSIFDTSNGKSYSLDTGVTFASLDPNYLPNAATVTNAQQQAYVPDLAGLNLTISAVTDTKFAAFIKAERPEDKLYWTITGSDNTDLVSTFTLNATSATLAGYLQYSPLINTTFEFYSLFYSQQGAAGVNSIFVTDSAAFQNAGYWGLNLQDQEGQLVNAALVGSGLNLWAIYQNQTSGDILTNNYTQLNLTLTGKGSNAVAMLTVGEPVCCAPPIPFPLPATAWMFLSGIMGLLFIKKPKFT